MKSLILIAVLMTLTSCAQIEKATEKWKTPEANATVTNTTSQSEKKVEETNSKSKTKKKSKKKLPTQ